MRRWLPGVACVLLCATAVTCAGGGDTPPTPTPTPTATPAPKGGGTRFPIDIPNPFDMTKLLTSQLDDIASQAKSGNVSKADVTKVTCFALTLYANRGRLPHTDEYDKFGASEKLKQAPVIGGQVEHTKTFLNLLATLNNNTPDKIALRAAVSVVCGGVQVIDRG